MSLIYVTGAAVHAHTMAVADALLSNGHDVVTDDAIPTGQEIYNCVMGADEVVLFYRDQATHGVTLGLCLALGRTVWVIKPDPEADNPAFELDGVNIFDSHEYALEALLVALGAEEEDQ